MKIAVITHLFPTQNDKLSGICNLSRLKSLRRIGYEIRIIKPVSIFPPIKYIFPKFNRKEITEYYSKNPLFIEQAEYDSFSIDILKWFPLPAHPFWWQQVHSMNLSIGRKIKNIILGMEPDLVLCIGVHPEGSFSRYLKRYFNKPVITMAEGSEVLVYPDKYNGMNKIRDAINKFSDKLIFVSSYMAGQAGEKFNFRNYKIVSNGYEKELFPFRDYAQKGEKFKIISVGSLDYFKGHDMLLEAVKRDYDLDLTIIGSGECKESYNRFIIESGMQDRARIIAYTPQEKLGELLANNDLFCLPSRSESFGVAALEAMATGLPVISFKTGEMSKIIKDGINGFLCENKSADELSEAIQKSKNNNWNRKEISLSVQHYGWDNWGVEMDFIIRELKEKYNGN